MFNATQNADGCHDMLLRSGGTLTGQSEDCLYINVYTTQLMGDGRVRDANKPVPVMFWIYGGSLISGSITS